MKYCYIESLSLEENIIRREMLEEIRNLNERMQETIGDCLLLKSTICGEDPITPATKHVIKDLKGDCEYYIEKFCELEENADKYHVTASLQPVELNLKVLRKYL